MWRDLDFHSLFPLFSRLGVVVPGDDWRLLKFIGKTSRVLWRSHPAHRLVLNSRSLAVGRHSVIARPKIVISAADFECCEWVMVG